MGTLLAVAVVLAFAALNFWTDVLNVRHARRNHHLQRPAASQPAAPDRFGPGEAG